MTLAARYPYASHDHIGSGQHEDDDDGEPERGGEDVTPEEKIALACPRQAKRPTSSVSSASRGTRKISTERQRQPTAAATE